MTVGDDKCDECFCDLSSEKHTLITTAACATEDTECSTDQRFLGDDEQLKTEHRKRTMTQEC